MTCLMSSTMYMPVPLLVLSPSLIDLVSFERGLALCQQVA